MDFCEIGFGKYVSKLNFSGCLSQLFRICQLLSSSGEDRQGYGREREECRAYSESTRTAFRRLEGLDKQSFFIISFHALQLLSHVIGQDYDSDAKVVEDRGTDAF